MAFYIILTWIIFIASIAVFDLSGVTQAQAFSITNTSASLQNVFAIATLLITRYSRAESAEINLCIAVVISRKQFTKLFAAKSRLVNISHIITVNSTLLHCCFKTRVYFPSVCPFNTVSYRKLSSLLSIQIVFIMRIPL